MHRYKAYNGAMVTTTAMAGVTTGTSANGKTMLQLATPSTRQIQLISWGYDLDDPPGADGSIELLETDVAATVTAHVAAGMQPVVSGIPGSLLTLGVSASGYSASAEGSITTTRQFDLKRLSSTSAEAAPVMSYSYQWLPDERPVVGVSKFVRIRATTPSTASDMTCWVCWDE